MLGLTILLERIIVQICFQIEIVLLHRDWIIHESLCFYYQLTQLFLDLTQIGLVELLNVHHAHVVRYLSEPTFSDVTKEPKNLRWQYLVVHQNDRR